MAFLGRESDADRARAERVRDWVQRRPPSAIASVMLGAVAVIDFFTLVLGVLLGLIAIGLGLHARRELRRRPELVGHRLAAAGVALGCCALLLSAAFYILVVR